MNTDGFLVSLRIYEFFVDRSESIHFCLPCMRCDKPKTHEISHCAPQHRSHDLGPTQIQKRLPCRLVAWFRTSRVRATKLLVVVCSDSEGYTRQTDHDITPRANDGQAQKPSATEEEVDP